MRIAAASIALLLAAAAEASAKELKPKFGNIDGVYYSDVSGNRDACRQAIKNKIALCRQNTNFESNTKNRKYKGCLPIFRRQAQSCVVHFRHQMSKCDLSGAARITDFTSFSCTATATVVEDGGRPDIAPLDRQMAARTRVNLRAGPGTNHRVVGSLRTGQDVQVTGRAGDWLKIAAPGGGTAFVHGDFMVASTGQAQTGRAGRDAQRKGDPESARLRAKWAAASSRCEKAQRARWPLLRERHRCRMNVLKSVRENRRQQMKKCSATYNPRVRKALRKADNLCCGPVRRSSAGSREVREFSRLRLQCKSLTEWRRKYKW